MVLGFSSVVVDSDLVITGEGRFDSQSLDGKVPAAVRRFVHAHVPVVVLAGKVDLSREVWRDAGFAAALSVAPGPVPLEAMLKDVLKLVETASFHLVRIWETGLRAGNLSRQTSSDVAGTESQRALCFRTDAVDA